MCDHGRKQLYAIRNIIFLLKYQFGFVIIGIMIWFNIIPFQQIGNRQMEKMAEIPRKMMDWVIQNRNMVFLAVCLVIHLIYLCAFQMLGITFLAALNLLSSGFYANFLFIKRDTSEKSIAATYFEILMFAFLSELALGQDYGFYLYMVGLSSAVFYLVPSYGNKRFLYQLIGIGSVFVLKGITMITGISFPDMQNAAEPYKHLIYIANLIITASVVLAATFFYSKETEKVWESLRYNMNHDALTGLYNRRYFERQIEIVPQSERSQYVISMVDIDFFKAVNDTYGHEAGDEVLVRVADCLKETAGRENLAVRWGGEEFILYFPKTTPDKIFPVMERVREEVEKMEIQSGGKCIRITITGGIATGMADSNYEKVIHSADEKLYLGKQRGRNRIIV